MKKEPPIPFTEGLCRRVTGTTYGGDGSSRPQIKEGELGPVRTPDETGYLKPS